MSLNMANKITILRLMFIPLFVALILSYREMAGGEFEYLRHWALFVFLAAAISDGVDGFIARKFKQQTALGTFLDPLADKLLLVTAIVLLSLNIPGLYQLPIWFPVLVLSRDLFLTLGSLIVHLTTGQLKVMPNLLGKSTTVLQMAIVLWVLLKLPYPQWILYAAAIFTFTSGVVYIVTGSKQFTVNSANHS